jgi:hypothetical protein
MAQNNNYIVYLEYQNLEDMLKVIIYSAQSMLGVIPMLYYIKHNNKHVMFIQTGAVGGVTVHYIVQSEKSLYVPIIGLEKSTLSFPT